MHFKIVLTALGFLLLLSGCAGLGGGDASRVALEGTHWQLVRLGDSIDLAYEQERAPSLLLDSKDERISGSSGCNRFMGSYTLDGNHITFDQVGMTRMACAKGMKTEQAYMKALQKATMWRVNNRQLGLFDAHGGLVAKFQAAH